MRSVIGGWLGRVSAFTVGVILGERLFERARSDERRLGFVDVVRDEADAIGQEIGRSNDLRVARMTVAALRGVVGFAPPGIPRIRRLVPRQAARGRSG